MVRIPTCTITVLLLLGRLALAAQYSFVNIADDRGPFDDFDFLNQAVSDTGTVAFIGQQGGVKRTYLGSGGPVQSVTSLPSFSGGLSMLGD